MKTLDDSTGFVFRGASTMASLVAVLLVSCAEGGSITGGTSDIGTGGSTGDASSVGGSSMGVGGANAMGGATKAAGGTTSASGGATTSAGGATAANGGATTSAGGATAATGGKSTANGGATTSAGGATAATGGKSTASGGTTTSAGGASGGTTTANGGTTTANGGTTTATGGTTTASGGTTALSSSSATSIGGFPCDAANSTAVTIDTMFTAAKDACFTWTKPASGTFRIGNWSGASVTVQLSDSAGTLYADKAVASGDWTSILAVPTGAIYFYVSAMASGGSSVQIKINCY